MNVIHLLVEWIVPLDDFVGRDAAQVSSYPVTDLQIGTEPEQQSILDAVPVATVLVDPGEQRIVYSNRAADALFEYDSGALSGVPLSICLPSWDEDVAGVPTTVPDVLISGGQRCHILTTRVQRLGGENLAVEAHVRPGTSENLCLIEMRPLTGSAPAAASELQELVSLLNATLESTADGILVIGTNGRITGINARFAELWRVPREVLATHDDAAVMALILQQLKDPNVFLAKVHELYADPSAASLDILHFQDGRVFERFSQPQLLAGSVVGRVWSFRDITSRRQAELEAKHALKKLRKRAKQFRKLAYTDPLTGLGNRARFNDALEAHYANSPDVDLTILLLDLDDFKEVNDIHGHQAGDAMLIEVARRLGGCVRKRDTIARVGGDEFVIVLRSAANADSIARRIIDALGQPVEIGGVLLRPSISLGIASRHLDGCPDSGASDLFRRADIAMYEAKRAGKDRFVSFKPHMMENLLTKSSLRESLRQAIFAHEILPAYQSVQDRSGTIVQYEALARWTRDGRPCPPDVFIPEAENSGLIGELGDQILAQACRDLGPWLADDERRSVAVNVSGLQVAQLGFASRTLATAKANMVNAHQLVLEVTEHLFFDPDEHVIAELSALRDAGARISLDDFGTGYSSFGQLQALPVDAVKLDRSFIDQIRDATDQSPIVESMVTLAHTLGLEVTAEGVEHQIQADYLHSIGCDRSQGFLYSGARPLAELAHTIHAESH